MVSPARLAPCRMIPGRCTHAYPATYPPSTNQAATTTTPAALEPEPEVKAKRSRPSWLASASVGMVALVATGALGYTLYTTSRQRDATQAHLNATETTLAAARLDAATRKVTDDYVAL